MKRFPWKPVAVIVALVACTGVVDYPSESIASRTTYDIELDLVTPVIAPPVVPLVSGEFLEERIVRIYRRPSTEAREIANAILEASRTFNIRWQILSSMVGTESSFDPEAESFAGAIGPLQVRPTIWGGLNYDLTDTRENVLAGAYILQGYKSQCGNWECAIAAYNVGITNFVHNRKVGAQQRYVGKVSSKMRFWE